MTLNEMKELLKHQDINVNTISFYTNAAGDDCSDSFFSHCDLTGELTMVSTCSALNMHGQVVEFDVDDNLIGGVLGKIAGAF